MGFIARCLNLKVHDSDPCDYHPDNLSLLEREMAIIGYVWDKLCECKNDLKNEYLHITVSSNEIIQYTRDIQKRGSGVIINNFNYDYLENLLSNINYRHLFQPCSTDENGKKYRIRIEDFYFYKNEKIDKKNMIIELLYELDPRLNYPMKLFYAMNHLELFIFKQPTQTEMT